MLTLLQHLNIMHSLLFSSLSRWQAPLPTSASFFMLVHSRACWVSFIATSASLYYHTELYNLMRLYGHGAQPPRTLLGRFGGLSCQRIRPLFSLFYPPTPTPLSSRPPPPSAPALTSRIHFLLPLEGPPPCVCMHVFIKLYITAQYGPVILVIICQCSNITWGYACVCLFVAYLTLTDLPRIQS